MIALIIFLIIVILVVTQLKKSVTNAATSKLFSVVRSVAGIAILLVVILSSIVQVGPGEVGVQTLFGSVQERVLYSGLNLVNPLVDVERHAADSDSHRSAIN